MEYLRLILFFSLYASCTAQTFEILVPQEKWDTIPRGKAVIYGNFIQGLGFKSGGASQNIHFHNTTVQKFYSMEVKGKFTSKAENPFIYVLPPGEYEIVSYNYSVSEPFGVNTYTNYTYPDPETTTKVLPPDTAEFKSLDLPRLFFKIDNRTLNYVGSWDFRSLQITFLNEKEKLDQKFGKYRKLDFNTAKISLPSPRQAFMIPFLPTGYINRTRTEQEALINKLIEQQQINIAPLFGRARKSKEQIAADNRFIDTVLGKCQCHRSEASTIWSDKGWDYFDMGDNEMASKRFNQAWLLDSTNYSSYWGLGVILGSQKRHNQALPLFQQAYQLKTNKNDTLHAYLCTDFAMALSGIYRQSRQIATLENAHRLLNEAEQIYPTWGKVHNERSFLHFYSQEFELALKAYKKAIALTPSLTDAKYHAELKRQLSDP